MSPVTTKNVIVFVVDYRCFAFVAKLYKKLSSVLLKLFFNLKTTANSKKHVIKCIRWHFFQGRNKQDCKTVIFLSSVQRIKLYLCNLVNSQKHNSFLDNVL